MKKRIAVLFLLVMVLISVAMPAYCATDHQKEIDYEWSVWVKGEGYVDPVEWYGGELGDESIPLYELCGLAAIAAVGAVVMHRKRQRVG